MNHIQHLNNAHLEQPSVVTIGMFDGVHRGHQALIKRLVDEAHQAGRLAVVITFFPHPDVVLRDLKGRYYLTTTGKRAQLLADLGVDCVVTHPFDASVRETPAADFVHQMIEHLNMKSLWVGKDFALGFRREGNVDYLTRLGEEKGYSVEPLQLITREEGGTTITSTLIRQMISEGRIEDGNKMLGRAYSVTGTVIEGDRRGRMIGFPTANLSVWEQQILPGNGVYACRVRLNDEHFMAVTNVGIRPTFAGKSITVEPHLLDFDRDIYGQELELFFEKRLRGEQKFSGIEELKAQLERDIQAGRAYLEGEN